MKRINGDLGLVWEAFLGSDLGFSYVRFTEIDKHVGAYVRILNYRRSVKLKEFNNDVFVEFDELVAPFLGLGGPPQRGENKWKPVGCLPMQAADFLTPCFKVSHPETLPLGSNQWFVKQGIAASDSLKNDLGDPVRFNHENVKHLGYYKHIDLRMAIVRIRLEWIKTPGMDFMNYEDCTIHPDF